MTIQRSLYLGCALLLLCGSAAAQPSPPPGEVLIKKMYEKHHDSWYDHLTFRQQTIFYDKGEVLRQQTWFEALSVPGRLVIKFDRMDSGQGLIFRSDSQFVFQDNKLVHRAPRVHDLLILGFDVYKQDPGQTIRKLKQRRFDLAKGYETEWQGRPVYVVGASGADDASPQFWIDKERLCFVRLLRTNPENGVREETRFNNYRRAGQGWVAPEVLFLHDGRLMIKEVYSEIRVHDSLELAIFEPVSFADTRW